MPIELNLDENVVLLAGKHLVEHLVPVSGVFLFVSKCAIKLEILINMSVMSPLAALKPQIMTLKAHKIL